MARNELKLNKVLTEMRKSEKTYNQSLVLLQSSLESVEPKPPIIVETIAAIDKFKDISSRLLSNIATAIKQDISKEDREILRSHRNQLFQMFFAAYNGYTTLYQQFMAEMSNNPQQFSTIEAELKESSKLGLLAHLIMPIQRGPRYEMLIKTLINKDNHLDDKAKEELQVLKTTIEKCLAEANAATPKIEKPNGVLKTLLSKIRTASEPKGRAKKIKTPLNYDLINQVIDDYVAFARKPKKDWDLDTLNENKHLIMWRVGYLMHHLEKQDINGKAEKRLALDKIAHHLISKHGIEPKDAQFFKNKFYKSNSAEMLFHRSLNQNIGRHPNKSFKHPFDQDDAYVYFRDQAIGLSSPKQELLKYLPIGVAGAAFIGAFLGTVVTALAALIIGAFIAATSPLILPAGLIIGAAVGVTVLVGGLYSESKENYKRAVDGAVKMDKLHIPSGIQPPRNYPKLFESSKELEKRYKASREDKEDKEVRTRLKLGVM